VNLTCKKLEPKKGPLVNAIFMPKIKQHLVKLILFVGMTSDHIFANSSPSPIYSSNVLLLEKLVHFEFLLAIVHIS